MKPILNFFKKDVEALLSGTLIALIALVIFFEVFTRFLLNYTPPGTEEIETLFFIWFVMFGAVTTTKKRAHVKIDFIISRFGFVQRHFISIIVDLLMILFCIFLVISGFQYVRSEMLSVSSILEIPEGYFALPIPLCGILMIIYLIVIMKRKQSEYAEKKKDYP